MNTISKYFFIFVAMITLYEIFCPITNGSVWIGITKNVELRYTQHMWGSKEDSKEKAAWCQSLKDRNTVPILKVLATGISKQDAKNIERSTIVDRLKNGAKLFNVIDNKLYYQYSKEGILINVFHTQREAKEKTGILPRVNRCTAGGYVWTYGEYDLFKLEKQRKARQVRCKQISQFDLDGNLIATFVGAREAGKKTGINYTSIAQLAGGKSIRKTAGGFLWKYT